LLQGALLQATADFETAKAGVTVAEANLARAAAAFVQAKADYDRAVSMAKNNVVTQQELDLATGNYESAKASRDAAAANVAQASAQVRQKDAAVSVARTNLDHTVIRSPIDGIVVARNVDVGQTVAASLQAPTIFTIAQDLTRMQVYAKVDESDVGRIKLGQPASFKVDAFPKIVFRGVVSQIRMNPTTVQNVVTYDAIIDFANPERKLFPGMTAYVTVPVATVQNVIKLPNAALRFRPRIGTRGSAQGDPPSGTAVVWKLVADHTIVPVKIAIGITDHAYTEVTAVIAGDLKAGDDVVTTAVMAKSVAPGPQGIRR
jgi:HlyD family secretion protein